MTMHKQAYVFFDLFGQVVVDDELHVGDVESSGRHVRRDQDFAFFRAKVAQSLLSLSLKPKRDWQMIERVNSI